MDNILYGQLRESADLLSSLADSYGKGCEIMALQLRETAMRLKSIADASDSSEHTYDMEGTEIVRSLRRIGIYVEDVRFSYVYENWLRISMNIKCQKRSYVTARELAERIGRIMKTCFVPAIESPNIVSDKGGYVILDEKPDYNMCLAVRTAGRGHSRISGDNFSTILPDSVRSMLAIADGMGCGSRADGDSRQAIEILEKLMESGFSEDGSMRMVNDILAAKPGDKRPVALDLCVFNRYDGGISFFKMGAAPSFIKRGQDVHIVGMGALAAGMFPDAECEKVSLHLQTGDFIVLVSDGVLDALPFVDKEKKFTEILSGIDTRNPEIIADRLLSEAQFFDGDVSDDMTIIVAGITRNNKAGQ